MKYFLTQPLTDLGDRVVEASLDKAYPFETLAAGGYLHLEVSEFIEALRNKRGDKHAEAADVMFQFMFLVQAAGLDWNIILGHLEKLAPEKE